MKSITCKQLGGACDQVFSAKTFDEVADMSKQHGMEMFQAADPDHLEAMNKMKHLMTDPAAMTEWFDARRKEFEALPDD